MLRKWALFISLAGTFASAAASNPCENVQGWRDTLCKFAKTNLVHPAWGYEHGIRDYLLSVELAKQEGVAVDEEVLFAAGMLHDMGGFAPYAKEDVDHALRSTQVVDPVLKDAGFPMEKAEAVKTAILTHSYYDPTEPKTPEAIALHDADALDFSGAITVARLLPLAGHEKGFDDTNAVIKILTKFKNMIPSVLHGGAYTKNLGQQRTRELSDFLNELNQESYGFALP